MVIIGHAGLSGFPTARLTSDLGPVAVAGFFGISGYLIAGSRARGQLSGFLWRRALRIFPAFWVCLVVVAFGFAPAVSAIVGDAYSASSGMSFIVNNALLWIGQWGIDGTLTTAPLGTAWNGSLWTLFYEFVAYLGAAAVLTASFVKRHAPGIMLSLLVCVTVLYVVAQGPLEVTTNLYLNALYLGTFFLSGMFFWSIAHRVPLSAFAGVACVLTVGVVHVLGPEVVSLHFVALPMAYAMLWLGSVLPVRIGSVNDLSYGIYIYAFPIQQSIAATGLSSVLGLWGSAVVAWVLTIPLAAGSWFLVEKPALRYARAFDRKSTV